VLGFDYAIFNVVGKYMTNANSFMHPIAGKMREFSRAIAPDVVSGLKILSLYPL